MKDTDPKEISGFGRGGDENVVVQSNTFCKEVVSILLAQPLNPLVKLEFEVIPKRNPVRQRDSALCTS